eukprot:jgi/Bigna1/68269/fgenesh1_pg.5_\
MQLAATWRRRKASTLSRNFLKAVTIGSSAIDHPRAGALWFWQSQKRQRMKGCCSFRRKPHASHPEEARCLPTRGLFEATSHSSCRWEESNRKIGRKSAGACRDRSRQALASPAICLHNCNELSWWISTSRMLIVFVMVFAVSAINVNVTRDSCGGNCPGGCDSCPCGTSSSSQSISSWCSKYSGWSQSSCECIMKHESGGNANAVNQNVGGSYDVGLWQINSANWASCSGGGAPCNPSTNLGCAKKGALQYDAEYAYEYSNISCAPSAAIGRQ